MILNGEMYLCVCVCLTLNLFTRLFASHYIKGSLQAASWEQALEVVANKLNSVKGTEIAGVAGPLADAEVRR